MFVNIELSSRFLGSFQITTQSYPIWLISLFAIIKPVESDFMKKPLPEIIYSETKMLAKQPLNSNPYYIQNA